MTIEQFIEIALEGGWHMEAVKLFGYEAARHAALNNVHAALLDPTAWKAVGKVRDWNGYPHIGAHDYKDSWLYRFASMPFAFADGKSLEEFLSTL